ncbi:hypothetical protein QA601_10960 [Chitinispirillales bacterium ANBcel5]|uniref:HEAT repeat domain-containing protein n=1 Tax=Cellulosispirillum alkaliphilum TaxID=3039283 RepID=UPI002A506559|nr:hypothetical protein [Chitinispirillales bacterium ANBcel5]
MKKKGILFSNKITFKTVLIIVLLFSYSHSKTRWSALQIIPSADMLQGGTFLLDADVFSPIEDFSDYVPSYTLHLGFSERATISLGYADGLTLGLKTMLVNEQRVLPSLTIGAQNVITHKQNSYFGYRNDSLSNEFFLAIGKSIEPIRTRVHGGLTVTPFSADNRYNPFAAIEKYFGAGVYMTVEGNRLDGHNVISLFTSVRFLQDKFEFSAGVIDLIQLIRDLDYNTFTTPGLKVSLKFRGSTRIGSMDGFRGVEDKITMQNKKMGDLRSEIDSLKEIIGQKHDQMQDINNLIVQLNENITDQGAPFEKMVSERLAKLKRLYEQEPFDPSQVNAVTRELVSYRDKIVPILMETALERGNDRRIRTLSVSILGEIGNRNASDVLLEILSQSYDPEIKTVTLVALGKLRETRAIYIIRNLTNDPDDAVAFTAAEVLRTLGEGTEFELFEPQEELQQDPDHQPEINSTEFVEEEILQDDEQNDQ